MVLATVIFMVLCLSTKVASAAPMFNLSDETIRKNVVGNSLGIMISGSEQRFSIKDSELTEFEVLSKKVSKSGKTANVRVKMVVDRGIADVAGSAKAQYVRSGNKWKFKKLTFSKTKLNKLKLDDAIWTGRLSDWAKCTVEFSDVTSDGYINALLSYTALPNYPDRKAGSHWLKGGVDMETGYMSLEFDRVEVEGSAYVYAASYENGDIYIDLNRKNIIGEGSGYPYYSLSISKLNSEQAGE